MTKLERSQIDFSTFMLYRLAEHWASPCPTPTRIPRISQRLLDAPCPLLRHDATTTRQTILGQLT